MKSNLNKKYRRTCDECGCMDMVTVVNYGVKRFLCDECLPMWVDEEEEEEYTRECNF